MPKNVFTQLKEFVDKPNRNVFDMSFTNNLTLRFGGLYPVYCQEVIPGDSFRITPSFGLRFMPLVFPVQTRMNANLHFFYVRNRNLWKDWTDFIGRTKSDLVPPYLNPNIARLNIKTGSLADYLGVPTTLVGNYGNNVIVSEEKEFVNNAEVLPLVGLAFGNSNNFTLSRESPYLGVLAPVFPSTTYADNPRVVRSLSNILQETKYISSNLLEEGDISFTYGAVHYRHFISRTFDPSKLVGYRPIKFNADFADHPNIDQIVVYLWVYRDNDWYPDYVLYRGLGAALGQSDLAFEDNDFYWDEGENCFFFGGLPENLKVTPTSDLYYGQRLNLMDIVESRSLYNARISIGTEFAYNQVYEDEPPQILSGNQSNYNVLDGRINYALRSISIEVQNDLGLRDVSEIGQLSPFYPSEHSLRISALPFRAYESIYNAFYRNQFNDPFIIDGQKEYNKFIRNNEGGDDTFDYPLYNRNYEMDFLTSAKQSPVDGDITPLVGVSGTGKFTFQNSDGSTYQVTPIIGEDGHTLTGIESVQGSMENNSGIRRLIDMVSVGISINDFRNVNSLQRWLETNLRRGYRYKDQLMSHFGVDTRFDELDMPEFIGGMSEPVFVNQINQSVDQTGDPSGLGDFSKVLGSFAGQASILAESKHSIEHYCDEHGFIIGILSVTPVPCYSQLLPKYFIKDNVLDYYFPEFGHIGNQPITYKEVCPIQTFAAGDALTDVFGYQRAWYDYLSRVDEVHGDYRLSLDGFLITRVFDSKPELGHDFIVVDDENMSNPFSVTDDGDKILGQVYFKVEAKRPIPKYGIPRLE